MIRATPVLHYYRNIIEGFLQLIEIRNPKLVLIKRELTFGYPKLVPSKFVIFELKAEENTLEKFKNSLESIEDVWNPRI